MSAPIISGCLDLGIAKPNHYKEVAKTLAGVEVEFVVLMEDRQPDFFLKYDKYNGESFVRLNRHAPHNNTYYPTQNDLKLFIQSFHDEGIGIHYGFWVHENRWVDKRHPELLLTDSNGKRLQSEYFIYDFNPLLKMEHDPVYGITKDECFVDYICKQYSNLADDFMFDGLFLGDGGMGFRIFGDDSIGVNRYDYSNSSIMRFATSQYCQDSNDHNCLLNRERIQETVNKMFETTAGNQSLTTTDFSNDIWLYHQKDWISWNCAEWTSFYKTLAAYLHTNRKEKLSAFNCMNYGPQQAIMHGVDYEAIATAGLDYLIFQTYDYAWGTHFKLDRKDIKTNFEELVSLNRSLLRCPSRSKISILFTAETGDSIENWQCPPTKTLEETRVYSQRIEKDEEVHNKHSHDDNSGSVNKDNNITTPLTDGLFIVWINDTPIERIAEITHSFGAQK